MAARHDEAQGPGAAPVSAPASDDAALLKRVAAGDQRAAAVLVDRCLPRLVAVARRILGDAAEAEDVAQEAFVRAWHQAGSWQDRGARFETWLHRVAVNLCYDRLRKRRETVMEDPPERADESPSAFAGLNARDIGVRVEAAMARLPPRQRAAIALCHYEEMSNIDAASVLDISVEALESLLSRGRRALRAALAGEAKALLEETGDG